MRHTRQTGYRSGVKLKYYPAPGDEKPEVPNILTITPDCEPNGTAEALHEMFRDPEWWKKFQRAVMDIPEVQ